MTTELIEWRRIKHEISVAKDIFVLGKMNYSLEAIQRWAKQSKQSLETQNEIAEYRLRLNRKQGEWIEQNIPPEGLLKQGDKFPVNENANGDTLTLKEAGIDYHDSPKFRILAKITDERFEKYITEAKEDFQEITTRDICRLYGKTIATKWTGDQENYTPPIYIEAARSVMGSIDCDPASNDFAQQTVKAKVFYTREDDGLTKMWGGNIFLNPPYSHPEVAQFVDKLLNELTDGKQAILLTNNNTDTNFFHKAVKVASAVCFTKGRINFYKDDGTRTSPTNGQVFFYFGNNTRRFIDYFSEFGTLMRVL